MARIWYCPNDGYEVHSRGRCHACREKLVASDLPELEAGDEEDEVGYRLGGWHDRDRGRLIEFLNSLRIPHRFEEDELVVTAEDEERVDDLIAELVATATAYDDEAEFDDRLSEPGGSDGHHPDAMDDDTAATVALLADAARRLRADPTDMQADADVAEASAAVFLSDGFAGVDSETWAAVGRVTRRLLTALGADEALEEEIRLQAGVLSKLLDSVPLSAQQALPNGKEGVSDAPDVSVMPASTSTSRSARLAVGTVYELPEWLPEQRAHLSVLLDDNHIVHEWEADDLVVESARENETEALFSLVGAADDEEEDDEADELRYHAIEELFNASGRLASDPEDPQRIADLLEWATEVDGPAPVGMNEVFWLRVVNRIHALTDALESGEPDDDFVASEAATLHDLLRSIV